MLPIGQALWLKELRTYIDYPALQDPASYNLDQVIQQIPEIESGDPLARSRHEPGGSTGPPGHLQDDPIVRCWRRHLSSPPKACADCRQRRRDPADERRALII